MLYLASPVVPQKIEAQAVPFRIHLVQELRTQDLPLGIIEQALKNRKLDPLPPAGAKPGYAAQPALACGILCIHVIADKDDHDHLTTKGG